MVSNAFEKSRYMMCVLSSFSESLSFSSIGIVYNACDEKCFTVAHTVVHVV